MLELERYQSHLDRVSRSFAFCIRRLDAPMRGWVSVSYLLCRILDTIEDVPWRKLEEGQTKYGELELFLSARPSSGELAIWAEEFPEISPGERALIEDAEFLFADFHELPSPAREAIQSAVLKMGAGMKFIPPGRPEKPV